MVISALWLALAPLPAAAATVSVRLETDRIEVDQTVRAVVNVVDYQATATPRMPPTGAGLGVEYLGPYQSFVMDGRRAIRSVAFSWAVTGLAVGEHTFGPVDVYVDGEVVTTEPVTLVVSARTDRDDDPLLEPFAAFLQGEVWEGQVAMYHYGYRARIPVYADRWVLPPMDRLQAPRDGLPVTSQFTIQDPTGPITLKETWHPLLATAPGELGVLAASAIVRIPDEPRGGRRAPFGLTPSRDVTVVTEAAPLTVRALPPPPPGFAGLVGDFVVEGRLDRDRLRVGESATITVAVRGDGSLEGFALPAPPELDALRFYDSHVGADARVSQGRYLAEGRWQRVAVPTQAGEIALPTIEIVAFSPSSASYVTHTVDIGALSVSPGAEGDARVESFAPGGGPAAEPIVADDDIRPIRRSGPLRAPFLGRWLPWWFALAAAPGLALLALDARAWARSRRAPKAPPPTDPVDLALAHPPGSAERLAALHAALATAPGEPAGREALLRALERARFAGEPAGPELEARIVAALRGEGR